MAPQKLWVISPKTKEELTQSTSLAEMLLSFATGKVLNMWWSGNTLNISNHSFLSCFFAPNTCDTVLWQNLLELLTKCADTEDPDELCTNGSQHNLLELIQRSHCQLQYTNCCYYILLQARPWLDSPFSCAKGNVSAFGGISCHAAADPARQGCSPAAGKGRAAEAQKLPLPDSGGWQHDLPWQPGRSPWAGWKNTQSNCRLAREVRGMQELAWLPPTKWGCYLGMTFLGQLWLLPQPGLDPQLSAGKLGGFKASYESLTKFKGKFKEANYRLLTKALPQFRKSL